MSATSQTQTGVFTDEFWVEDLKGDDAGYYTTLQLSGNLEGPGSEFIPAANVAVKVDSTNVITMAGSSNPNVEIPSGLLSFTALNSAVSFIQRPTGVNNGLIGMYGAIPELQVLIPAYQAVGTYVATMIYTIYEN